MCIMSKYTQGAICLYRAPLGASRMLEAGGLPSHPVMVVSQNVLPDSEYLNVMVLTTDDKFHGYELILNHVIFAPVKMSTINCEMIYPVQKSQLRDILGFAPPHFVKRCLEAYAWHIGLSDTIPEYVNILECAGDYSKVSPHIPGESRLVKSSVEILDLKLHGKYNAERPEPTPVEKKEPVKSDYLTRSGSGEKSIGTGQALYSKSGQLAAYCMDPKPLILHNGGSMARRLFNSSTLKTYADCRACRKGVLQEDMRLAKDMNFIKALGVRRRDKMKPNCYIYTSKGGADFVTEMNEDGTEPLSAYFTLGSGHSSLPRKTRSTEKTGPNVSRSMAMRCNNIAFTDAMYADQIKSSKEAIEILANLTHEDRFRIFYGRINDAQLGRKYMTFLEFSERDIIAAIRASTFKAIYIDRYDEIIDALKEMGKRRIPSDDLIYFIRVADTETLCKQNVINWQVVQEVLTKQCGFDIYRDTFSGMCYVD